MPAGIYQFNYNLVGDFNTGIVTVQSENENVKIYNTAIDSYCTRKIFIPLQHYVKVEKDLLMIYFIFKCTARNLESKNYKLLLFSICRISEVIKFIYD